MYSMWIDLVYKIEDSYRKGLDEDWAKKIYSLLSCGYISEDRFYHNFSHIAQCLEQFDEVKSIVDDPIALELSLWFHDIVYDLPPRDNESRSAKIAFRVLSYVDIDLASKVKKYIEWTEYGKVQTGCLFEQDFFFLRDIDHSSFGSSYEDFQIDSVSLSKECIWKTEEEFYASRIAYFQNLLSSSEPFFKTDYFHNKFESQMRSNLSRALADMQK